MADDRRIRRTKAHLRRALTRLLREKDLKDITISELTELADMNRGTFYLHYKDIYDLFDQIEAEILKDFTAIIARHLQRPDPGHRVLLPILQEAFAFIADNADVFIALLRTRETTFLDRIIEMCKPDTDRGWQTLFSGSVKPEYYEYYYAYVTSGFVGMAQKWFVRGMPETPEQMARLAGVMMSHSLEELS